MVKLLHRKRKDGGSIPFSQHQNNQTGYNTGFFLSIPMPFEQYSTNSVGDIACILVLFMLNTGNSIQFSLAASYYLVDFHSTHYNTFKNVEQSDFNGTYNIAGEQEHGERRSV